MAEESVVVIEEKLGPTLKTGRLIQLIGPALPLQGATWAGELGLVTQWYPGNSAEATQHILGPRELPSEWEGIWRTTQMVSSPSTFQNFEAGTAQVKITRASTMRDLLEEMFRNASLLLVAWHQGDRKIIRYGRASRWEFPHDRMDDIHWHISFAWMRRGGSQQRVVTFRSEKTNEGMQAVNQIAGELLAAIDLDKIKSIDRSLVGSASVLSLGDLEALLNAPGEFLSQFTRMATQIASRFQTISELVNKVIGLPDSLLGQILDAATNAASVLAQVADEASRLPLELQAARDARAISYLRATRYFNRVQEKAETGAALANELARLAKKRLSSIVAQSSAGTADTADILGVHLSKEGETFASISILFYGTPDNGPQIAKANGFPGYQIAPPPGYPLIIPNAQAIKNLDSV